VPEETAGALWDDWAYLLELGVRTGQMMTIDGLEGDDYARALASRDDRHWVYHRAGKPCRVCGTDIVMEIAASRKLYYCPNCQA
jgi:endonuclease-8